MRLYTILSKYRFMSSSTDMRDEKNPEDDILKMVTEIVSAYVSKNNVAADELPAVIRSVHATLGGMSSEAAPMRAPAVPVKKSVTPDYIVCLEDGRKLKMLKRYLRAQYNLTPEAYRAKWNLPADYPMTAPNYAAKRSAFAKEIGLGRMDGKPGGKKKS